eukprot:352577-Chlamydomonas_euryale.AAC.2
MCALAAAYRWIWFKKQTFDWPSVQLSHVMADSGIDTFLAEGRSVKLPAKTSLSPEFKPSFLTMPSSLLACLVAWLQAGGYLVELTLGGLCLATFTEPLHAVAWSVCLVEALKVRDCMVGCVA